MTWIVIWLSANHNSVVIVYQTIKRRWQITWFDCLIDQLNSIRLTREAAVRVIGQSDCQEAAIVRRIQSIRMERPIENARAGEAISNTNRHNNLRVGHIVRITNRLRDKHNSIGKVSHISRGIVEIRNQLTEIRYLRVWWNLEPVEAVVTEILDPTEDNNYNNNNAQ